MAPQRFIEELGHFANLRFLRQGGMADIYSARDIRRGGEEKAVKLVRRRGERTRDVVKAEKRGAHIQAHLAARCKRVASIFDHGDLKHEDYIYYIEMTLLGGCDLDKIKHGRFDETEAVQLACGICELLVEVHTPAPLIEGGRGYIIHGDIKPDNIRITRDGIFLLDFGSAQEVPVGVSPRPIAFYSPHYVSPERIERHEVRPQDDLWASAVILYEMVTGERPWDGDKETVKEAILTRNPGALPEDCSEGLERFLRQALHRRPERRFQSAAEMVAELKDLAIVGKSDSRSTGATSQPDPAPSSSGTTAVSREPGSADGAFHTIPPASTVDPSTPPIFNRVARLLGDLRKLLHWKVFTFSRQRQKRWAALLILTIFLFPQLVACARALALNSRIRSSDSADLETIWTDYQRLDPFFGLGWFGRLSARRTVREAMIKATEDILETHEQNPSSAVSWIDLESYLEHALEIGAGRSEHARLAYARGHILRGEGNALSANNLETQANEKFRQAIDHFQEAARLAPDWPSPYLGLSTIYAYFATDLGKLEEAIAEGRKLRTASGISNEPYQQRETAQLADLHRRLCSTGWNEAKSLSGQSRSAHLQAAAEHCEDSIKLYDEILDFGFAKANRSMAENQLRRIQRALR